MLIKSKEKLSESMVTPENVYADRRTLLKGLGLSGLLLAGPAQAALFSSDTPSQAAKAKTLKRRTLKYNKMSPPSPLIPTPEIKALTHNNFYEFGTGKSDPVKYSQGLQLEPWTLSVEGEVAKPGKIDVWELINGAQKNGLALEERMYRMRCVEAWSMVLPWVGIELGKVLKQFEPTSKAKYVAFETLYDPEQMPGQKSRRVGGGIDYPYIEGLRMDEAMHPLTLLSVGLYGKALAPQNGAPIRLVVPWKYGFKGIKSIVKIRLVEKMPPTTWNILAAREYGFYANVNPAVDHPRWSQASERLIGDGGLFNVKRQKTLPFNGYADEVAGLYSDMNLKKWF